MVYFAILILIVVSVHEFGHYIAARVRNISVDAFSIGFGPKIISLTDKRGTIWKICLIPLGCYVKMLESIDKKNSSSILFENSHAFEKIFIAIMGPVFNFLLFILIVYFSAICYGTKDAVVKINDVIVNNIASKAGMQINDRIESINGLKIRSSDEIDKIITSNKEFTLKIKRENKFINYVIKNDELKLKSLYDLGIIHSQNDIIKINPIKAIPYSINKFINSFKMMYTGFKSLFSADLSNFSGPIKIAKITKQVSKNGIKDFLAFISIISLNLGFFNLLPIPGLDGGMIFVNIVQFLTKNKIKGKYIALINYVGLFLIFGLIGLSFYNDILGLVKKI